MLDSLKTHNYLKAIRFGEYKVFTPDVVQTLKPKKLMRIARQASSLIELLGEGHMEHHTPDALCAYLQAGMACCAINSFGVLGGFIKTTPWLYKQGHPEVNKLGIFDKIKLIENGEAKLAALETSSLVVHPKDQRKGLGKELKILMAKQASAQYPEIPVIAVIDKTNEISVQNNKDRKWIPVDNKTLMPVIGIDVLADWGPESTIYMSPESYLEFIKKT